MLSSVTLRFLAAASSGARMMDDFCQRLRLFLRGIRLGLVLDADDDEDEVRLGPVR